MAERALDRRIDGSPSASRLARTRRWWVGLDRGWRASILGLLVVAAVFVF